MISKYVLRNITLSVKGVKTIALGFGKDTFENSRGN
jgi:hypothetical protein